MKKLFIILAAMCMLCSVECYSQDKVVAKDVFKEAGYKIVKAQMNGAIQPDCEINYIGKDPDNIESVELVFREEKYQKTIITIIRWEALEKDSVIEEDLFIKRSCGDIYYVIGRGSVVEISYNDNGEVADRKITKKDTIRYRITDQFFYALKSIMDESIAYKEDKYRLYPGLQDSLDFY